MQKIYTLVSLKVQKYRAFLKFYLQWLDQIYGGNSKAIPARLNLEIKIDEQDLICTADTATIIR